MHAQDSHLSLTEAAKIIPGRPSTNCVWRWCRRGVRSRTGERIKLEHVRIGGKIFTRAEWVHEFGQRLAESDAAHFDDPVPAKAERAQCRKQPNSYLDAVDMHLKGAGL